MRRNDRNSHLVNGQVLTVNSFGSDGTIETEEGKTVTACFRHFTHGYVVTSHKSQGRTHDQVVVAAEKLDAKAAYVACSRGRWQCSVHTPDKESLLTAFSSFRRPPRRLGPVANVLVHRDRSHAAREVELFAHAGQKPNSRTRVPNSRSGFAEFTPGKTYSSITATNQRSVRAYGCPSTLVEKWSCNPSG